MNNLESHDKFLVVTADDFGLDASITQGIIKAHTEGIVTATSVLVNAPHSSAAFQLAKTLPRLEFGLHLAIVESKALNKQAKTIIEKIPYFGPEPCLISHWQKFIPKFMLGRITLSELEREFELQFELFLKHFSHIPFINGTQHLHLLPRVQDLVLKLAQKYQVKAIRSPIHYIEASSGKKIISTAVMLYLGRKLYRKALAKNIKCLKDMAGFDVSGMMNEDDLAFFLESLRPGITEICCHPGFHSLDLQKQLPHNYQNFAWETELQALTSERVKKIIKNRGVVLTNFSQVTHIKNDQ